MAQPYRPVVVVGKSMSPTYVDREVLLSTTNADVIKKGDVVIIDGPDGPLVKRVAFAPGDWMELRFFAHQWRPAFDLKFEHMKRLDRVPVRNVQIPQDYVYVVGDNPIHSIDSRHFGVLPLENIRGKVLNPRATQYKTQENSSS